MLLAIKNSSPDLSIFGKSSKQTCPSKTLLQILGRRGKVKVFENNLSGTLNCDGSIPPCFECKEGGTTQIQEELNIFLEEADALMIPYICYNILNGYK